MRAISSLQLRIKMPDPVLDLREPSRARCFSANTHWRVGIGGAITLGRPSAKRHSSGILRKTLTGNLGTNDNEQSRTGSSFVAWGISIDIDYFAMTVLYDPDNTIRAGDSLSP